MKSVSLLLVLGVACFYAYAQTTIINGDFETWGTDQGYDTAYNWTSYFTVSDNTIYTASKTTDAAEGSTAALLQTVNVFGQIVPGIIELGDLSVNSNYDAEISGGQPFTSRPTGVHFSFKYEPANGDTAVVGVYLTKWNTAENEADTIATGFYICWDNVSIYKDVYLPLCYKSTETPDTINVVFLSSSINYPQVGSKLWVDDVRTIDDEFSYPVIAYGAENLTTNSFTAKWQNLCDNTVTYHLDVATDAAFNNILSDYNDVTLNWDQVEYMSYPVTDVSGTLYYRVRVEYQSGDFSDYSNIIKVTLPEPASVSNVENFNISLDGNLVNVSSLPKGTFVGIYGIDGRRVFEEVARGQFSFTFKNSGVYIMLLKTQEIQKTVKLVVR